MGILDPKTRVFDTFLTEEGRAQLAQGGKLRVEFYSFSDSGAVYLEDTVVSGSGLGLTDRFVLEAGNLPQDRVTFEADDSGNLVMGRALSQVYSGSRFNYVQGKAGVLTGDGDKVTGVDFASLGARLLDSSLQNWQNLQVLGSPDLFDDRFDEFLISNPGATFHLTKDRPIPASKVQTIGIDEVETLWQDKRLSHIPNFQFLPPRNKARTGFAEGALLGDFVDTRQNPVLTWEELWEQDLKGLADTGFRKEIRFTETSRENNLFGQWFELESGKIQKLDVIDFGEFLVEGDSEYPTRHVWFVGKVFQDSYGSATFVNLFTMVWKG